MKNKLTILFVFCCAALLNAQVPAQFSYQAVFRNSAGEPLRNTQIGMRISILQGSATGTVVYTEIQNPTTNDGGLISIQYGEGEGFDTIDWSNGAYFLKTEADLSGGANYTIEGTSQILAVPYAIYAKTSGSSIPGPKGETGSMPGYEWDGTFIRFENLDGTWGEFVDLKGEIGSTPKHEWDGTSLQFENPDGSWGESVDLKGIQGAKGDKGDQGIQGAKGETGFIPRHEWNGTFLRFENPDGSWGESVDLKGTQGIQGIQGPKGDVGAQGPAGTVTHPTYALCAGAILGTTTNLCDCGTFNFAITLSRTTGNCTATSQSGNCSSNVLISGTRSYAGSCCVCRPR
jgi:hypothetical protein